MRLRPRAGFIPRFSAARTITSWNIPPKLAKHVTHTSRENTYHYVPQQHVAAFYQDLFASLHLPLATQEINRSGSVAHWIVSDLLKKPLVLTPQGDSTDTVRRFSFTARFHTLTLRDLFYDNPYIQFLYLLHELGHISTLQARPNAPFREWAREIERNELTISCITEALVYFDMPSLRKHTFKQEIWVDKFLNDKELLSPSYSSNRDYFAAEPDQFFKQLFFRYVRTYSKSPDLARNENDRWMIYYREKTSAWHEIWREAYSDAESKIQAFRDGSLSPQDYLAWLDAQTQEKTLFLDYSKKYINAPASFDPARLSLFERQEADFNIMLTKRLADASDELASRSASNKVTMTPLVNPSIITIRKGVTPTIYSLWSREVKSLAQQTKKETMDHSIHANAAERRQDEFHIKYLEAYANFVAPVVGGLDTFKYAYPTNGSSEGLKDILAQFRAEHPNACVHVFKGEYEGAIEYARALKFPLRKHARPTDGNFAAVFQGTTPGDVFYLSQPSGLDGNVWLDYDAFIKMAEQHQVRLIVDLAYVGTVAKKYHIDVDSPAIIAVVGSLSKLGPYYMRIGYCYSRQPSSLLTANKWFKNLDSEALGIKITTQLGVHDLGRVYQPYQMYLINRINHPQQATDALNLVPSDVFMVATQTTDLDRLPADYTKLIREHGFLRACLSTGISSMVECEETLGYNPALHRRT